MSDPFLGEIKLVPYGFEPKGWAYCDGRELPINQNQALFALLGTNFGGDGRTTFRLPTSGAACRSGRARGDGNDLYARRDRRRGVGEAHARPTAGACARRPGKQRRATTKKPASAWPAAGGAYAATSDTTMGATMIGRSGSGKAHDNRQPYIGLAYVIALQGIFPSRN